MKKDSTLIVVVWIVCSALVKIAKAFSGRQEPAVVINIPPFSPSPKPVHYQDYYKDHKPGEHCTDPSQPAPKEGSKEGPNPEEEHKES